MVRRTLALLSLGTLASLVGCYVDNGPRRSSTSAYPAPTESTSSGSTSGSAQASSSGSTQASSTSGQPTAVTPVLAVVDSNQTVTAVGGDGVGVFVEYVKGGEWHVFWTCDTTHSARACDFDLRISAGTGKLAQGKLEGGLVQDNVIALNGAEFDVKASSTTEVHGLRLTSEPGAVLTIDAKVDGLADSAFFFFVQDGKVNGGYAGKLTNPLQFVGKTP